MNADFFTKIDNCEACLCSTQQLGTICAAKEPINSKLKIKSELPRLQRQTRMRNLLTLVQDGPQC